MSTTTNERPCLLETVKALIAEFRDTAALRKSSGDENGELAFGAAADRVQEVFLEFGERMKSQPLLAMEGS